MDYGKIIKLMTERRSCRNYTSKKVSTAAVNNCLEAARLAPSACNKQPWKFVIVRDSAIRDELYKNALLPCLPMPWVQSAPIIIAICAKTNFITHKVAPFISNVDYRLVDIGIAGEHFVLAAEAQKLSSCWIGWFKEKSVKKILDIPKNIKVISLMTLGYSANKYTLEKKKKFIKDISYHDMWDQR
jgi:nitroreductase